MDGSGKKVFDLFSINIHHILIGRIFFAVVVLHIELNEKKNQILQIKYSQVQWGKSQSGSQAPSE